MSKRNPLIAVQAFPEDGRAYIEAAELALRQAVVANEGQLPDEVPSQAVAFSRRGFANEPLGVEAAPIIALDLAAKGEDESARRIMRLIPTLSKRERTANIWLADDHAKLGDDELAFHHLDLTLRTSSGAQRALLPAIVQTLARDEAIKPLANLLKRNPPWAVEFWREAVRNRELSSRLLAVRMAQSQPPSEDGEIDQILLRNLIGSQDVEGAAEFYHFITGQRPSTTFDEDFDEAPSAPPFDWDLRQEGDLETFLSERTGELLIRAIGGSRGVAVRRLLFAEPGSYQLVLAAREDQAEEFGVLRPRLRYACGGSIDAFHSDAQEHEFAVRWTISNPPCSYYWLELMVSLEHGRRPIDLAIASAWLVKIPEAAPHG